MDLLTQATASFRRRLLGLSSKDAQFRNEVRQFATVLMQGLANDAGDTSESDVPFPPSQIAACRLKSEAMLHIGTRLRDTTSDELLDLAEAELIEQASSLNCYLWMLDPSFDANGLEAIDTLAGCFDTLADAATLANEFAGYVPHNRRITESLLKLVAKAQSALREAIRLASGPEDQEQRRAFRWVRSTAEDIQVFIHRHMKEDDPADPESWMAIGEEIESFRLLRMAEEQRQRATETLFDDLFALVTRLDEADEVGTETVWREIVSIVDGLVSNGVPPRSLEFRELLRPHIADAPEAPDSAHFDRVRKYVCQGRTTSRHLRRAHSGGSQAPSQPVTEVAGLLRGRSVLLIGGNERPHQKEAIATCFSLKELIWISTTHGTSVKSFEPHVANEDVVAVLLAIRWASHSYGDIERYCDRYGKPLVRLPGGYSPDQVAHQILSQCSDRLRVFLEEEDAHAQ